MADEQQQKPQQQQPTQEQPQQQGKPKMLQARTSVVDDDYQYEIKMPPRPPFDRAQGVAAQSGGLSSQFEIVSSGLNNTV